MCNLKCKQSCSGLNFSSCLTISSSNNREYLPSCHFQSLKYQSTTSPVVCGFSHVFASLELLLSLLCDHIFHLAPLPVCIISDVLTQPYSQHRSFHWLLRVIFITIQIKQCTYVSRTTMQIIYTLKFEPWDQWSQQCGKHQTTSPVIEYERNKNTGLVNISKLLFGH